MSRFPNSAALCRYVCAFLFAVVALGAYAQVDVLTQHNDNGRTGVNSRETTLTPANVNKARFGLLFKRTVDDQLYTQPLVVSDSQMTSGTRDVVYVTTVNNSVYAFDANALPATHGTSRGPEFFTPTTRRTFGTNFGIRSRFQPGTTAANTPRWHRPLSQMGICIWPTLARRMLG